MRTEITLLLGLLSSFLVSNQILAETGIIDPFKEAVGLGHSHYYHFQTSIYHLLSNDKEISDKRISSVGYLHLNKPQSGKILSGLYASYDDWKNGITSNSVRVSFQLVPIARDEEFKKLIEHLESSKKPILCEIWGIYSTGGPGLNDTRASINEICYIKSLDSKLEWESDCWQEREEPTATELLKRASTSPEL